MKTKPKKWIALISMMFIISISACSGGGGDDADSGGSPAQASGTVGSGGGTVEVTSTASPIKGTKVVVPADAIDSGEQVTISINYTDKLPGSITTNNANAVAVSKVIVLTKNSTYDFKTPVDVVIPYTNEKMKEGDIPSVAYWDEAAKKYWPVSVKAIDTANKLVTFSTIHFTSYVTATIPGLWAAALLGLLPPHDTGFKPDVDGFFHVNTNIYDVGLGSCVGMSSYAAWYFVKKKATDGTGLYNKYRQGDINSYGDDVIARELLTRAALASSQAWQGIIAAVPFLSSPVTGLQVLQALMIYNEPQVMVFNYQALSRHAVTVYKYDNVKSQFHIYDCNYPGQVVTVDWSPALGLYNYSAPPPNTTAVFNYTFDAIATYFKSEDFENFYLGAANGWTGSKFNSINITSPVLDANSNATVSVQSGQNFAIQGTVTGGDIPAKYLAYKILKLVTGGPMSVEASGLVILGSNGSFSLEKKYTAGKYWIVFLATDHATDAALFKPHAYAGLKEIFMTVNVTTTPTLTVAGSLSLPSPAMNVQVIGNLAYIRDYQNGLRIVDVSTPAAPTMKGAANISYLSTGNGIFVNSPYAYVGSGAFYIVDVSNPMSPVKLSSQGFNANAGDLVVADKYAYIAAGKYTFDNIGLFAIADITDPANTTKNRFVGGLEFPGGNIRAIAISGSYAYLVDTSKHKMYAVSISDPANPVKMPAEVALPYMSSSNCGIFKYGDKAYIADADGFSIVNISSPESPFLVKDVSTAAYMKDVWVSGTRAYFLSTYKLYMYDVTTPANPTLVTSVDLQASTYGTGLFVAGNTVYVTQETSDSKGMLTIFNIGN